MTIRGHFHHHRNVPAPSVIHYTQPETNTAAGKAEETPSRISKEELRSTSD